jgi:hypothetical protein
MDRDDVESGTVVAQNPLNASTPVEQPQRKEEQQMPTNKASRKGTCITPLILFAAALRWMRLMNPLLSFLFIVYNLVVHWSIAQIWQVVLLYIWLYFPASIISFHQKYCHCGHSDIEDIGCLPAVFFVGFGFPWILYVSVKSTCKDIIRCATNCESTGSGISWVTWFYDSSNVEIYALKSPYLQFLYFLCLPLTFALQTYSNDRLIVQEVCIGSNSGTYTDSIAYHASDPFVLAVYSWIFVIPVNSYHIVVNGMHAQMTYDSITLALSIIFLLFGIGSLFVKQFVGVTEQRFDPIEGTTKIISVINLK